MNPLCIDLFCGLGGWTEGFLAEGYRVVGFDIEIRPYPAQLVIQDVLTIHGSQFKGAAVIVASPPCQKYSYLAMPWSRSKSPHSQKAKALRREWETNGPDNRLFDACFRIQREAIEASRRRCEWCDGNASGIVHEPSQYVRGLIVRGEIEPLVVRCKRCGGTGTTTRYIPLIVENVRGAQPWVGRSAWNYGSFHLWGDVPALMPINFRSRKAPVQGTWFKQENGYGFAGADERKNNGGSWFHIAHNTTSGLGNNPVSIPGGYRNGHERNDAGDDAPRSLDSDAGVGRDEDGMPEPGGVLSGVGIKGRNGGGWFGDARGNVNRQQDPRDVRKQPDGSWETPDGTKIGGDWFSDPQSTCRKHGSRSNARKMASAQIAKIPLPLAEWIAKCYYPRKCAP